MIGARVEAVYYANAVVMKFLDAAKARAAYDKLSKALQDYRQFSNDRHEVVEVEGDSGPVSFKLERLDAVIFNDNSFDEEHLQAALTEEKRIRDMRESLGLPNKT